MFKEVSVVQVREVLRRWLSGNDGLRRVADAAGVDRKTARRYVEAAESLGRGWLSARSSGLPGPARPFGWSTGAGLR